MENKNPKNEAQQILKRIEKQSAQEKRRKTMEMLQGKGQPVRSHQSIWQYFELVKKLFNDKKRSLYRKWANPDNQKMVWLTLFLSVSTYLCFKVESKYDDIRKKTTSTKTFKEAQIQRDNLEIEKLLKKGQFESVPIRDEPTIKNTYKFEEEGVFSTRDDLLEEVAKEYKSGIEVDKGLLEEARKRGFLL